MGADELWQLVTQDLRPRLAHALLLGVKFVYVRVTAGSSVP